MRHIRTAETPAGQRYTVVAAPPGSALDAGSGDTRGGPLGALLAVAVVVSRSLRRGWRLAVTPCDERGRPTGAVHRERVADERDAEARAEEIVGKIGAGKWPDSRGKLRP